MIAMAIYEHTDIPPGMTCAEYRTRGAQAHARGRADSVALALLYPIRLLAHLTEPAPAPGAHPAALYVSVDAPTRSPSMRLMRTIAGTPPRNETPGLS